MVRNLKIIGTFFFICMLESCYTTLQYVEKDVSKEMLNECKGDNDLFIHFGNKHYKVDSLILDDIALTAFTHPDTIMDSEFYGIRTKDSRKRNKEEGNQIENKESDEVHLKSSVIYNIDSSVIRMNFENLKVLVPTDPEELNLKALAASTFFIAATLLFVVAVGVVTVFSNIPILNFSGSL